MTLDLQPEPEAAPIPAGLICLACYIQAHNARAAHMPVPPLNEARLIANGAGVCLDHLQIQSPGSLIVPPGTQLPRANGS